LHSAITRQDKSQQPEGGWYPAEAFTTEQAIRAYTTLAAYAAFRELETGSIEIGKWADLTVMDIDPFSLDTSEALKMLGGKIEMTIVAGKVVHDVHE
jgi:predicted amidohydrolase YtcJ